MRLGDLLVGAALAIAAGATAWRLRALTATGAVAAAILGTLAVAAGWSWAVLLIAYFVTSTLLSRFRARDKQARAGDVVDKHGPRDAGQVLANGGMFGVAAMGSIITPHQAWPMLGAAALAASAADTWATEIGLLAGAAPRSIIGWRAVSPGTSGGITMQGLFGATAGAVTIAVASALLRWPVGAALAALLGGIAGCVLDSLLGATLQSRRWCPSCGTATEQRIHRCGNATQHVGGVAWVDNDMVNAIGTVGGALLGVTIGMTFDA